MTTAAFILADLGLERSVYAERGLIALAIIACALGSISTLRWWLQPPAGDRTAGEHERGWPFMRRTLIGVGQTAAGVLAVLLFARLTLPAPQRPEGWLLISPPNEISTLALQGDTLWAGGREGLFAIDRKSAALIDTPLRSRDLRAVRALIVEGETLWIGCKAGVFRWNGQQLDKLLPPSQADTGPITALRRTRDGAMWIGATLGAWRLTADQWQWFGEKEGLRLPMVDTIYEDKNGALWFASKEPEAPGLWRREGEKWTLFDASSGLAHPAVNDIREDHQGTLWIACGFGAGGAAYRFENGRLSAPFEIRGLSRSKIRSLFQDTEQRLWFCSEFEGVAILDGTNWRRLTLNEGLPGNEIKVMLEDGDGTLWLGNEHGLGRIIDFK
ncbi:two-component regulator propeller domain-containing protein [Prosthecobacter sp.]|uniref:ligand-binding sensor domain-containing protein n=1 Tax=Prosthecobacter sp. TaxID=1965333 RepID=UPI002ABA99BE|nr:two-component regulator propeller domain-containing protein [Prosthecobacter sp.]MDZ4403182.1 two-component regulator propeller domain-containing protein [Prosthecobacter sp.]